ncbi:TraM recognition domain-containing protein [Psychrobacillus sp. FSL K6-2684]|uniref:type IV secretory system conjugative DNA transfer family protein n=1 Tax=unclassified Psychrobacillus TaxID=2636677 RepID=UPI0030F6A631
MINESKWSVWFPFLTVLLLWLTTLYFGMRSWVRVVSYFRTEQIGVETAYFPLLFGDSQIVSVVAVLLVMGLTAFSWLISTRAKAFQTPKLRVLIFLTSLLTLWGSIAAYGMSEARRRLLPFFDKRLAHIFEGNNVDTNGILENLVIGQVQGFYLMITIIPVLVLFFISYFLLNKYVEFDVELRKAFFNFQWRGRWLQKFSELEKTDYMPDIYLGETSVDKEMVTSPGGDRTLGTVIVGSIGTGKTAALAEPIIDQDLDHMVRFVKAYPTISQRADYKSQNVLGRYLNGLSIIEPSNDLCKNVYQLAKAHGIPDEAITYINPLDPNTPSINPMRGPVDKVAEIFAQIIAGLSDNKSGGGSFYFEQAQRNHLKHHIYLLKLHDPNKDVNLDMLLDMYNDPQLVRTMQLALKTTIPDKINEIVNRDERNHWKIVKGIDDWFNLNLIPKVIRQGNSVIKERNERGDIIYMDALETDVKGLRNILNDIGANKLIRRVLFGDSDFDFDRHFEMGGLLLVNTAKGELVDLAKVLGKIVLMNLQNGTFRREPKVSPFHHIVIDEAPDYFYSSFREFPAQARKYKVIITPIMQSLAQMADQFGEFYMMTIIGTLRNRMVYGDVSPYDADFFSKMFGEKYVYEEGQSEMSVSPLQEDPVSRSGSSYSKVRDMAMTSGEIMYQEAFQCAVKLVVHNKPMPVVQIDANFIPEERYTKAKIVADEKSLNVWLESRRNYRLGAGALDVIESIEETESKNKKYYKNEQVVMSEEELLELAKKINASDVDEIERIVNIAMDTQPRDEVRYGDSTDSNIVPAHTYNSSAAPVSPRSTDSNDKEANSKEIMPEIIDFSQISLKSQPTTPRVQAAQIEPIKVLSETDVKEEKKAKLSKLYEPIEGESSVTSASAPVTRSGYTQSQLSKKGEQFIQDIQKLTGKTNDTDSN